MCRTEVKAVQRTSVQELLQQRLQPTTGFSFKSRWTCGGASAWEQYGDRGGNSRKGSIRGRGIPALKNQLRNSVLHRVGKTNSSRRGRSLRLHHFVQAPLSYEGLRPQGRCCLGTVSTPWWAVEDLEGGVGYRSPRSVSAEHPAAVSRSALSAALLPPRPLSPCGHTGLCSQTGPCPGCSVPVRAGPGKPFTWKCSGVDGTGLRRTTAPGLRFGLTL